MTTHDTPEAALAAALHDHTVHPLPCEGANATDHKADAAAILATLDGWTLVPDAERAAWATLSGDLDWAKAEIERLTKIEAAARAFIAWQWRMPEARRFTMTNLRAALAPSEP